MRRRVFLLLAASLTVSACGGWRNSGLNPGNWFGRSRAVPNAGAEGDVNPLLPSAKAQARQLGSDPHVPIDTIVELRVERTTTGAIVRATGIATQQGAYEARLTPVVAEDGAGKGVLGFTFEVIYPISPRPVGSERTRTVLVARALSNQELQGARLIRVTGASNSRETRRR